MSNFIYLYYRLGLFLLSATKSESLLLALIIFVSNVKHLDFWHVFLYMFLGSFFWNNIIFILGRYFSESGILKELFSDQISSKINNIISKYRFFFVIFYRFLNGFKLITPFVSSQYISFCEFFAWNFIGDILWTVIFIYIGNLLVSYNIALTKSLIFLIYCINFAISSIVYFLIYRYVLSD